MFVNDYGEPYPSKANNAADVITVTDIGGIGSLIYHTFRFKEYEFDEYLLEKKKHSKKPKNAVDRTKTGAILDVYNRYEMLI